MLFRASVLPALLSWFALMFSGSAYSAQVNADYFYFHKGNTPENWQWVIQDPGNWWLPLEGNSGVSAAGKLTLEASDAPEFPGAVKLTWGKQEKWGGITITGRTVDLSAFEHNAELVLAVKLDARTKKPIKVKMTCGDKCEAEVSISDHLKAAKLKEWFALPIPLDCFVAQGANLKNITSPFQIGTDGKMILHIAEISIQKMVAGDEGCTPNNPPAPQADAGVK